MSARPGRVKAVVDVDFDKTGKGIFKDKRFAEKVDEIWDLVRSEAILAQGVRA
jgi:NitT/TauT family transport system ATP-binding protein